MAGSALLGLVLIAFFVLYDLRDYLAGHSRLHACPACRWTRTSRWPGPWRSFWGFVWPWILIAMYRRPLRRLIDQMISEVDAAAAGEVRRG